MREVSDLHRRALKHQVTHEAQGLIIMEVIQVTVDDSKSGGCKIKDKGSSSKCGGATPSNCLKEARCTRYSFSLERVYIDEHQLYQLTATRGIIRK